MSATQKKSAPKLLTRAEAADYLKISIRTLNDIINKPDFPAIIRLGNGRGRVFINRERLDQWLDEKTGE